MPHLTITSGHELSAERALLMALGAVVTRSAPDSLFMVRWYCAGDSAAVAAVEARWANAAAAVSAREGLRRADVRRSERRRTLDVVLQAAPPPEPPAAAAEPAGWAGWADWARASVPRALALMLAHARYGHADGVGYVLRTERHVATLVRGAGRAAHALAEQSGAHVFLLHRPHRGALAAAARNRSPTRAEAAEDAAASAAPRLLVGADGAALDAECALLLVFGHRWAAKAARRLVDEWLARVQAEAAAGVEPSGAQSLLGGGGVAGPPAAAAAGSGALTAGADADVVAVR